jgi:3-deoxy-7-phosphoheptulonate synthase
VYKQNIRNYLNKFKEKEDKIMIVSMKKNAPQDEVKQLINEIEAKGLQTKDISGENYIVFGVVGDTTRLDPKVITAHKFVDKVTRVQAPFKKVNRLFHPEDTVVEIEGIKIGGDNPVVIIGGPCSVEGEERLMETAKGVKAAGAKMIRGGAYKPRTSPYSFQGMEKDGLKLLKQAKDTYGLPVVTELMSADKIDEFIEYADIIQIGARNMQNFSLLKAVGKLDKPVLLKRGMSNTVEEWLMAAEYIMAGGNDNVILCERGIRTFENATRNTLDLSVIPIVKKLSHLPVVIDPSHASGRWDLVEPLSLAAIAAGADGLIIEVHNEPEHAWSDGGQSLKPKKFKSLIDKGRAIAQVIGRDI